VQRAPRKGLERQAVVEVGLRRAIAGGADEPTERLDGVERPGLAPGARQLDHDEVRGQGGTLAQRQGTLELSRRSREVPAR
jgi:hypothetical protein